ncbi:MAG: PQQ-binding-like beta-propeller repeat protein [Candidatus Thermoplasmatota archaeon]|nr:PQQ-binding-like beta-propeller repeat protein [Candidatus Thermoplasmatota archaeon]MBU1942004.1 PQQ-binding-like beta-propeller repeat protein [Candidatus Thermoplasmatota archaeon]
MTCRLIVFGIILALLVSCLAGLGLTPDLEESAESLEPYLFERSVYDCYNLSEIPSYLKDISLTADEETFTTSGFPPNQNTVSTNSGGVMNSSWPMYCHDTRHTGLSPFSTADNPGVEIWRFKQDANDFVRGSPIIDGGGVIYFGASDFYAIYPNGTRKWKYNTVSGIRSCPAMGVDGTIYIGTTGGDEKYLYAFTANGTLLWTYPTGDVYSSPVIGEDGSIYFGDQSQNINALYPNGTVKWRYKTDHVVYSSPAIGDDGAIYCGSHDTYLYALYPNNGTLKWRYKTDHWIRTSPCIAEDGTIYVVSLDNYLHAVNPDGTVKWMTNVGSGTSPTIDQNGIIYCGYSDLYAINPLNGFVLWVFDPGPSRTIRGATPCHSADGTTYFGTHIGDYGGGEIIAVNPDGTERWRKQIANEYVDSAPAIAADGTIYVGSACDENGQGRGYLHAFGKGPLWVDANGPYTGVITKTVQFNGDIFGGLPPYNCSWEFGDGNTSTLEDPQQAYTHPGTYNISFTVFDAEGNSSTDTTLVTISSPQPQVSITRPVKGLYYRDVLVRTFSRDRLPLLIGGITIEAVVAPDYLGFDHVEFIVDNVMMLSDDTEPYSFYWDQFSFSTHTLMVKAVDGYGNSAVDEVTVWKFF